MPSIRPCLRCGTPTRLGSYCEEHRPAVRRERWASSHDPFYDSPGWRRARARVVDRWIRHRGLVCPGFGAPAHVVASRSELTADHIVPRGLCADPLDESNLAVLCRRCNSRKGGRARAGAGAAGHR